MEILPLISFFTGVISILSPCILPIIPIFVAFSLNTKTKTEILSFTLGLLSIFVAIIFLTGFFTSLVYSYMFYVRIISAAVLLVMGILMFVGYSFSFKSLSARGGEGVVGSFVLGFLTSVSWAPCYSGYLISLIALLVRSGGWYVASNIVLYCAGFAMTLFVLSLMISKINIERLVLKTRHIPKIFGALIIIGAIYLLFESLKVLI